MWWGNMWQCEARLLYEANRRALGTGDMVTFFFQFVSSPIVLYLAVKQNLAEPKLNLLLLWSRSRRILKEGQVKRLLPQSRSGGILNRKGSSWHALRARNAHLLLSGFDLLHHAEFSLVRRPRAGRDPFNQNSNRSDREKWSTSKGGPVFLKLIRLDQTDPLSFGPRFSEILVKWIAPHKLNLYISALKTGTVLCLTISYW